MEYLSDEKKLFYYALKFDNETLRIAAIRNPNLNDEETLIDFAKYGGSYKVRLEALKKHNSQELFTDLAFHDSNPDIRIYAANQFNSKNALRELIKNDGIGIKDLKISAKWADTNKCNLLTIKDKIW